MSEQIATSPIRPANTEVLYNDTCPICRFEIAAYKRRAVAQNLPIRFDSLDAAADWGLTADEAARRLHVIHRGRLLAGIPAFIALWSELPRWRWAARVAALPGLNRVACLLYDRVLAPSLYRAHLRRRAKKNSAG